MLARRRTEAFVQRRRAVALVAILVAIGATIGLLALEIGGAQQHIV